MPTTIQYPQVVNMTDRHHEFVVLKASAGLSVVPNMMLALDASGLAVRAITTDSTDSDENTYIVAQARHYAENMAEGTEFNAVLVKRGSRHFLSLSDDDAVEPWLNTLLMQAFGLRRTSSGTGSIDTINVNNVTNPLFRIVGVLPSSEDDLCAQVEVEYIGP